MSHDGKGSSPSRYLNGGFAGGAERGGSNKLEPLFLVSESCPKLERTDEIGCAQDVVGQHDSWSCGWSVESHARSTYERFTLHKFVRFHHFISAKDNTMTKQLPTPMAAAKADIRNGPTLHQIDRVLARAGIPVNPH
jgi:hypothetical protein